MAIIYIGIGSNLGDKEDNLNKAIHLLETSGEIELIRKSSFYITKPLGGPPQDNYLNGVLKVKSDLAPEDIFDRLKSIEKQLGREKAGRNFPRLIDLDILIYDEVVLNSADLVIPHPRMRERKFVLKGFAEIDPDLVYPGSKETILELYRRLDK
jgi:2-amino-4-hydroxy-6-hydroxymethyldihydropteridine diphosphokinase